MNEKLLKSNYYLIFQILLSNVTLGRKINAIVTLGRKIMYANVTRTKNTFYLVLIRGSSFKKEHCLECRLKVYQRITTLMNDYKAQIS